MDYDVVGEMGRRLMCMVVIISTIRLRCRRNASLLAVWRMHKDAVAVEDDAHNPDDPTITLAEAGAAVEHVEVEKVVDQDCMFSFCTVHAPAQQAHSTSVAVRTFEPETPSTPSKDS